MVHKNSGVGFRPEHVPEADARRGNLPSVGRKHGRIVLPSQCTLSRNASSTPPASSPPSICFADSSRGASAAARCSGVTERQAASGDDQADRAGFGDERSQRRCRGRQSEVRRHGVEIQSVHLAIEIEVPLAPLIAGRSEIGRQCREIQRVHRPVEIRIPIEKLRSEVIADELKVALVPVPSDVGPVMALVMVLLSCNSAR